MYLCIVLRSPVVSVESRGHLLCQCVSTGSSDRGFNDRCVDRLFRCGSRTYPSARVCMNVNLLRMPSTHSAVITYYAAFTLLACTYLPLHPSLPQAALIRVIAPLIVVPWSAAIAISRIWLGHHTWPQVGAGCAYGLTFTFFWFKLWTHTASAYGQEFERTYMQIPLPLPWS